MSNLLRGNANEQTSRSILESPEDIYIRCEFTNDLISNPQLLWYHHNQIRHSNSSTVNGEIATENDIKKTGDLDEYTYTHHKQNKAKHLESNLLIFGFVRKYIEDTLDTNSIIPCSVLKLCEIYFAFQWIDFTVYNESWYQQIFIQNELKSILSPTNNLWSRARWAVMFSKTGFYRGIHCWKIKCVTFGGQYNDMIGIATKQNTTTWLNSCCVGISYYAFDGHLSHYIDGEEQISIKYGEMWTTNDQLIVTLDFIKSKFEIVRIRDSTLNEIFVIDIDANHTYYPCIGMRKYPATYELYVC